MYIIELIFKRFSEVTVGNKDIIKMLVATVHPDEVMSSFIYIRSVFISLIKKRNYNICIYFDIYKSSSVHKISLYSDSFIYKKNKSP